MTRLLAATAIAALALLSASAWAGPREDGDAAWRANDYATAAKFYRQAAEQGDPGAMTGLARLYQLGSGIAKDLDESAKWNRRAAEIYRQRAEQGDAEAQYALAALLDGLSPGMPADPAQHLKWISAAAEQDHIIAQTRLGVIYSQGLGVPPDKVKAYTWWLIASGPHARPLSDRDNRFADIARSNASDMKLGLTAAQIAQAQKAAAGWKPKGH